MSDHPLLAALLGGDRRALAKAITLIESTQPDARSQADALLVQALASATDSLRVGISGAPGAGKSTFIESLGLAAIAAGHRVAVLAVDPSSGVTGGSILGDKTRMERLSVHDAAFIRPSPSSGVLGGVAERTREVMLLCEAAGYDVVMVETVGVGQSETTVAGMTDLLLLLQLPNAGDDLQAIKRGLLEKADLFVVNKADLDPDAARRAAMQLGGGRSDSVSVVSALHGDGVDAVWKRIESLLQSRRDSGEHLRRRKEQSVAWMWDALRSGLAARLDAHPAVRSRLPQLAAQVEAGELPPSLAARMLIDTFLEKQFP